MKVGLMKVWNEIELIEDTLDHFAEIVDHMIVYDDASTDGTADILMEWALTSNNLVVMIGEERHSSRPAAQGGTLQLLLQCMQSLEFPAEWVVQMDCDERIEMPQRSLADYDAVRMRLYDFYITEDDVHLPYTERKMIGPEYRNILMMYRPFPGMAYGWRDQREMWGLPKWYKTLNDGFVRHYGKAVSVERWERQCDYYALHFPEPYKSKWENRRGKAIHTDRSDFGNTLITWDERRSGFPL